MRRRALLTVLILIGAAGAASAAPKEFYDANTQYQTAHYKEAAEIYERLAKDAPNATVYYNLGNAYFRVGQKGKALAALEKAHAMAPRDEDVRWNLETVRSTLKDVFQPKAEYPAAEWLHQATGFFSLNELATAWLMILGLFLASALIGYSGKLPALRRLIFLTALVLFAACSVLFGLKLWECHQPRVVLTEKEAVARYGPSSSETKAFPTATTSNLWIPPVGPEWSCRTMYCLRPDAQAREFESAYSISLISIPFYAYQRAFGTVLASKPMSYFLIKNLQELMVKHGLKNYGFMTLEQINTLH